LQSKLESALQVEKEFLLSIGNEPCTIDPIEEIRLKLCATVIDDVVLQTTITAADALCSQSDINSWVDLTNPNPTVADSFIPKTKSELLGLKEFDTSSFFHIKEFHKPPEYVATSLFNDHAFTLQCQKRPNEVVEELTGADLTRLLSGTPLTLEDLRFSGNCDGEMIPMGFAYKMHGCETAEHFVGGKLLRISQTQWMYYLNDGMGIRKNKGDRLGPRRPWVRVTTEIRSRASLRR